jgi:hypothetical protein
MVSTSRDVKNLDQGTHQLRDLPQVEEDELEGCLDPGRQPSVAGGAS